MSIISYAQNFEDVMLWRALSHVEHGFYIDIGAQDPLVDSVSLAFHEHGWHGIHVEPTPHYAELLRQQRPGDTVIQAAVGKGPDVIRFFEIPDTGISTADPVIAQQHRERGFDVHEITVPCIALSAIFKTCAGSEIHWLKIDVEGFEKQVLSSWGKSAAHPWIVIVESTLPLTQIETHESWEAILIGYGYTPVYFDGLNRYYISDAHPELKNAFLAPPNVFDDFTLNGTASAPFHQLIKSRYQEKISEILAQNEQQKQTATNEIERLTLSLAALDKTHAEREQTLQGELAVLRETHTRAEREAADREKALTGLAQQTLDKSRNEAQAHLRELIGRERDLTNQLAQVQSDARQSEAVQARAHAEQTSQIRQELENFLRTRVLREREVAAQLLAIQQQAAQEMAEQAKSHSEQERALQRQHTEREQTLAQQLQAGQQELRRLEQNWAQREQEVAAQLLAIQQQAAQEMAEQAKSHSEQERALQRQHAEREQSLAQQLQAGQQELRHLEQNWAQREKALEKEITAFQSETQALYSAQKLQAQQHSFEISTKLNEHNHLIQSFAAFEAELKAQIQAEQQTGLRLRQTLAEVQQSLEMAHASLSWRMTRPLRTLAAHLIALQKNPSDISTDIGEVEPQHAIMPTVIKSPSTYIEKAPIEAIMLSSTPATNQNTPSVAATLDELLARHDQAFIKCAYQTLLERNPDPEGMKYYLGRLRTGFSKLQIVAQLRFSKEGNMRAVNLPKLDTAIQRYQRGQYPLIGWLFRLLAGIEGNYPTDRKLRAIENQIFVLSDESNRRFNQMEAALSGLHHLVLQQTQSVVTVLGGKHQTNTDAATAPVQPPEQDGFKKLSPNARGIYFQLKRAAAIHAGRAA